MKLLFALSLAACAPAPWEADATVMPVSKDPRWAIEVQTALDAWHEATGCSGFTMGGDGYPIKLVPEFDWGESRHIRGYWDGDQIQVRGDSPLYHQVTLMHEIGHAMGLSHSDSPSDVMYKNNTAHHGLSQDDVNQYFEVNGGCR